MDDNPSLRMAADERLKWLETRINSSLKLRSEDLRSVFNNDDNRLAFYEFVNNEDIKRLYVYKGLGRQVVASLQPPGELHSKSIFFLKGNPGTKLTKDNMDSEVFYMDCSRVPLEHLELTIREVFLPLLATNTHIVANSSGNGDKIMDILHRLMAAAEVSQGHVEGLTVLHLPSIEVLAEAAASPSRRAAVLHVLETTVIGWIKQVKGVLRHNPLADLIQQFGNEPGPLDEVVMWKKHLEKLESVEMQLDSETARDILKNLEMADSQYGHSFTSVRKDIAKAKAETQRVLKFLSTLEPWYNKLHTETPTAIVKLFKPLMHVMLLVWTHSTYYHQIDKFHQLLCLLSNEIVHKAIEMVGDDVLREPLQSYSKLKEALKFCAAFRGTYLDFKEKADDQNAKNIAEHAEILAARPRGNLFKTKMYGPHAYTPRYGLRNVDGADDPDSLELELWMDSPWPARNAPCFDLLNSYMERCNDVLELVETTRHFRLLSVTAEIGGAGSPGLDSMVKELHNKYSLAMKDFFSQVTNVLSIDGTQNFERAFFNFRSTVKDLEKSLAGILRIAFDQCPNVQAQLRLLEVFEGISGRELVQQYLKDIDKTVVKNFSEELHQVKGVFQENSISPPAHRNMPYTVSKLMWSRALRERIEIPMKKMKHVSPHLLEGDSGWQMRDLYTDIIKDLDKFENEAITRWEFNVMPDLNQKLKDPLLIAEEYDDESEVRPQVIHVNLDTKLLLLLKEIHYLSQDPFSIHLPGPAKELLRNTNSQQLSVTAARLETIVSKYNAIMRSITAFEKPMFERKLAQIDNLLEQGLHQLTWKMKESADFIETAYSTVCLDVHQNLDIVQTNCREIIELTHSWSNEILDVFSARERNRSYLMDELLAMQKKLNDDFEAVVTPASSRIHNLMSESYEVVQISEASPAWRDYVNYIDAIILDGLKLACLTSLKNMLNTMIQSNLAEEISMAEILPILTIRLELIENNVDFRPPLDQSTSVVSVQELVQTWLQSYLARGRLVKMLGPKGSYEDYITLDEEVKDLLVNIDKIVMNNSEECKQLLEVFKEYSFLWQQDVNQTFTDFLDGNFTPNPLRARSASRSKEEREKVQRGIKFEKLSSRTSSARSAITAEVLENAEKQFLAPKSHEGKESTVPSLDEFDQEIDIYRTAREEISNLDDHHNVGWISVDLQPIKQVLTTYAAKWIWTYTQYLSLQVTSLLEKLDLFMKRIEPEIEQITGEERDTASFMKMMRLFNEVSSQQTEMDGKFAAMNKTVLLLKKYGQVLPDKTQHLFNSAPTRWNSLKTKVSLAKQRLGPRIQEESVIITKDLTAFAERVMILSDDLENSEVYQRNCDVEEAHSTIDELSKKLTVLEGQAQDLNELQELLEASVVNFSDLPKCRKELTNLKLVWNTFRIIDEEQSKWKQQRWQRIDTAHLREETSKQLDHIRSLPDEVFTWDVYMGMNKSITTIQECLPLVEDLSNAAIRTRHWKQLVRVTGGAFTIDNDSLKRMTFEELLSLGLQKHVDDVRAIVLRAVKDLAIETALKNYEEIWLGKIFEMRHHVHVKMAQFAEVSQDSQSENSQGETNTATVLGGTNKSVRAISRSSNQSSHSKNKRGSVSSLPTSLLNLGEDTGAIKLLTNTEPIFNELEHHQITLQAMQSNSSAGSFQDEVLKWQKKLQVIEGVLQTWLEVQEMWVEMEEVYLSSEVRQAMPHEALKFSGVNKDFRLLMRATEKNPNVMQCCNRKNIPQILEHMRQSLEKCRKSLLHHLEKRRHIFPRFFFLSMEDVLRIICHGYDLNSVNLYISKLLQNVGSLVFDEADENDQFNFVVTGVQSTLGERLLFGQVINCEGQIENWMNSVLNQLRSTLRSQLAHALPMENATKAKTRQIHSAGARRVSLPIQDENSNKETNEKPLSAIKQEAPAADSNNAEQHSKDNEIVSAVLEQGIDSSWALDHVTEIVYLATCVQMTGQISDALANQRNGDRKALGECLKTIDSKIENTVLLLRGLENDKKKLNSNKKAAPDEGMVYSAEELNDGFNGSHDMTVIDNGRDNTSQLNVHVKESQMTDDDKKAETSTLGPLDSMSMIVPPTEEKDDSSAEEIHMKQKEQKMLLLPSQLHKLTSLLSLLSHLRDLIQRLVEISSNGSPEDSFDWKSQLLYNYSIADKTVTISCMKAKFEYGFEYLGSSSREVISPVTEKVFFLITQAIKSHIGLLCVGPREGTKFEVVQEVSKSLGQPLYMFNCAQTTIHSQLQDIFRGLAATGCWVCFNDISYLKPSCLSLLAQMVSVVMEALKSGKSVVHLLTEDVQLSPNGACFGLMDSAVPVTPRNSDNLFIYPSAAAKLPDNILQQFRVISFTKPDLSLSLEAFLLCQGFVYCKELAWKIVLLYETCGNMFGTNTFISNTITLGSSKSASFYGWSIQSLKGVVSLAGTLLRKGSAEDIESSGDANASTKEETALATALRDCFLPRMTTRDASVFATVLHDLWPQVELPMIFGGEPEPAVDQSEQSQETKADERIKSSKSVNSQKSLKDSIQLNTPVVSVGHVDKFSPIMKNDNTIVLEDVNDAIAVATADLGLLPGTAFQARVMQLAHLNIVHQSILVVGPSGCGKSECIKTFAVAERERGKNINVQSVFIKAVESEELIGYFDSKTREWHDGLLTALLRKFCVSTQVNVFSQPLLKIMQLDGECDGFQMELLHTLLNHTGSVVLPNNERLSIPDTVKFIWELESLENMSPSLLATVGVLVISASDVGWKLMLVQWLEHRNEPDKDLLTELSNTYIETLVDYVTKCTQPSLMSTEPKPKKKIPQFKRVISHSLVNMVRTFTNLLEVLIDPFNDLTDVEYERYFNFAAVWAFGGTLAEECREEFSDWWKDQFRDHIDYPSDGTVFDYLVDNETHEFCKWSDLVPSYSGTPHRGIPSDAFVHTVYTEQLLHLLGLLTDAGRPVMLVGENGCGKTAIINERIRTICSGEVAEVLSLTVNANRFTNARLLFDRIDERLEWKHGRTFVPRGNKRMLCLIDDINLSQTDKYGFQTACELIREHLDDGGFYSPANHTWRYVKSLTYVTSVNPRPTADVPPVSQRLLRHFAVFGCPYPRPAVLQTIFGTLLSTHFFTPENVNSVAQHSGANEEKAQSTVRFEEESLRRIVHSIVKVTVELSERMRSMFLPTAQRCHYIFTKDLGTIFRNLCLSLQPGCNKRNLLLLWQHECFWVYGKRMASEVDSRRFRQAFNTSVRKQFIDDDQVQSIIKPRPPLFSNLIEQDSGLVTAGMIDARSVASISEEDAKTDMYRPAKSYAALKELLEKGLEEYNKIQPRIKLSLYKSVIEQVCRLARTIASPHEGANTVMVAEGCPARCSVIARLAAHLCGFSIMQISPMHPQMPVTERMSQFKANLVSGYTRAGARGDKVLLLLREEELSDFDYLIYLTEFIQSGAITHLFTQEEQTTIINSIRTEVTQAGLTYTRDVAWEFFLRTVKNNFRVILIACGGAKEFQHMCREYPSFTKSVNFIWFPHWSKSQLIEHTLFHFNALANMTDIQKENVAHMLASMHLVLRQQDGGEKTPGEYGHVTNTSYEKCVQRFISLANERNKEVESTHNAVTTTLEQIKHENELAVKLKKQLEHEKIVLEEHKAGTIKILSQIGQDTAITEQQVKVVKNQMEKIAVLKKRLPEYQVTHERSVYKAIAIIADTKKVVKLMDINQLSELRGMQKPSPDIEDLMSTIIMLLKSPSADLTWQKGAKRLMANLERFIEELTTFDDYHLSESTLNLVEPYLKKPSFDPETMTQKSGNSACGALCRWVRGVVGYHRIMISKVKPLHQKVEETAQAVDAAQHRMNTLENKRKALEVRLADLARAFEEATIDKNEQEEKTIRMKKMLDTAAELRRVLSGERTRCNQIFDSYERRLLSIPGSCAMASAFVTYLGPYHHSFRRVMLTVHWPACLRERGIPLVIDSIDGLRGRVCDWSIPQLRTASGASNLYGFDIDYSSVFNQGQGSHSNPKTSTEAARDKEGREIDNEEKEADEAENGGEAEEEEEDSEMQPSSEPNKIVDQTEGNRAAEKKDAADEKRDEEKVSSPDNGRMTHVESPKGKEEHDNEADDDASSETVNQDEGLSIVQYNSYVRSVIKILIGESVINDWIVKDLGPLQIENAAILCSSWQRPPLMIDPNDEAAYWLGSLNKIMNKGKLMILDMEQKSQPHLISSLEKAITKGRPVLLKNCSESIDNTIMPLVLHRNTAENKDFEEEPRMIQFCGRRTLCHPNFRCYMSTHLSAPKLNPVTASSVTLISFGVSRDTLTEDLLSRLFGRIRPELFVERKRALKNLQLQKSTLYKFSEIVKDQVLAGGQEAMLSSPKALQFITNITEAKLQLAKQLASTQEILYDLDILKDELHPIAHRASLMFSLMRSLEVIYPEYNFTLKYFLDLFDEAVGGELPTEFFGDDEAEVEDDEISIEDTDKRRRLESAGSQNSNKEKFTGENTKDEYEKDAEGERSSERQAPAETEGSISTGAVQKLVHGSESDALPPIEMPDTVTLPTDGVEYSAYTDDKLQQLMDRMTGLIYHRIKMCLLEEDQLLFSTLMCLHIKSEAGVDITSEEMSLFYIGNPGLEMQLTLSDFDCKADVPAWLSKEKWEDILALSLLPGPLESFCVEFATNAEQWKKWFESPDPETRPLPSLERKVEKSSKEKVEDSKEKGKSPLDAHQSGENELLNDFHVLLLLRLLRPDRIPAALTAYTQRHLAQYGMQGEGVSIKQVLSDARRVWGVLLLLPQAPDMSTGHPATRLKLTSPPVDELVHVARTANIPVQRGVFIEGSGIAIEELLDAADKANGWAIIESVHLASAQMVAKLVDHLQRIHSSRVSEKSVEGSNFCIWLTAQTNSGLPPILIENLLKMSWNAVLSMETHKEDFTSAAETKQVQKIDMQFSPLCPETYLKTAIVSALRQISKTSSQNLQQASALGKMLAFGAAVIHGILTARQLFGSVGLARWHPFSATQIANAVELITSETLRATAQSEPSLEDLCNSLSAIYFAMVSEDQDQTYILTLCRVILTALYKNPQGKIQICGAWIPLPPTSIDVTEMADWFEQAVTDELLSAVLQLNASIEKNTDESSASKFLSRLEVLANSHNLDSAVEPPDSNSRIDIAKLRSALDICLERLPPLLDLGDVPRLVKAEYDFPYHPPSIISMSSAESTLMPETVGYVLLQECLWMDTVLCHIRQEIHDLEGNLLGGPGALPRRLMATVLSLQEEFVPVSWIHPNNQPCTHSLTSWIDDLNRRHHQLNRWVRRSMVPKFIDGQVTEDFTVARGQLTSVWLGGLVNPHALLTALRQEKAILSGASLEDIFYECVVLNQVDQEDFEMEEVGLFISDLYLENAGWDYKDNQLTEPSDAGLTRLQSVYLKPSTKPGSSKDQSEASKLQIDQSSRNCHLPVFINKSRQVQICWLPVRCSNSAQAWILKQAAFILDPGLPEGGSKKSRAFLMLQRFPPMIRVEQEEEGGEEEKGEAEDLPEEDDSEESVRSQLSYKPISPKAPPLLESLVLKKEQHILMEDPQRRQEDRGNSGTSKKFNPDATSRSLSVGDKSAISVNKGPSSALDKDREDSGNAKNISPAKTTRSPSVGAKSATSVSKGHIDSGKDSQDSKIFVDEDVPDYPLNDLHTSSEPLKSEDKEEGSERNDLGTKINIEGLEKNMNENEEVEIDDEIDDDVSEDLGAEEEAEDVLQGSISKPLNSEDTVAESKRNAPGTMDTVEAMEESVNEDWDAEEEAFEDEDDSDEWEDADEDEDTAEEDASGGKQ